MSDHAAPQFLLDMVTSRYDVTILDSHYMLVDERFQQYDLMYDVVLPSPMETALINIYGKEGEAHGVQWFPVKETNSYRFSASIGNHILLLWDSLTTNDNHM